MVCNLRMVFILTYFRKAAEDFLDSSSIFVQSLEFESCFVYGGRIRNGIIGICACFCFQTNIVRISNILYFGSISKLINYS